MLRRYNEWRAEHSQTVAKAKAAGIAEGIEQGMEQGMEQGKVAERQRWEEWYQRLQTAVARGEPFDEPPPSQNGTPRSTPKGS